MNNKENLKPLAIDLFCGLGGWTDGLLSEGWDVIGFDIERHDYGTGGYPAQLVLQDILTLHGKQFRNVDLIVASPPCQEFSYMAMPWSKAKAKERDLLEGRDDPKRLTALFDACFRIQREACEAAGRHIPMVVENVRGAQKWVGRSRFNYGSFYLWGDVPALMPMAKAVKVPMPPGGDRLKIGFQQMAKLQMDGIKLGKGQSPGKIWSERPSGNVAAHRESSGIKQPGIGGMRDNGKGNAWFQNGAARSGSKSSARKAASAMIAKIPLPLSRHIAAYWKPT